MRQKCGDECREYYDEYGEYCDQCGDECEEYYDEYGEYCDECGNNCEHYQYFLHVSRYMLLRKLLKSEILHVG